MSIKNLGSRQKALSSRSRRGTGHSSQLQKPTGRARPSTSSGVGSFQFEDRVETPNEGEFRDVHASEEIKSTAWNEGIGESSTNIKKTDAKTVY
jgi:hypothetical protein